MAYNSDGVSDFEAHLDLSDLAYSKFLRKFTGESPAPVTRKEHTAFLLYWLCHNLFYTCLQKINRDFVPIAVDTAVPIPIDPAASFLPKEELEEISEIPHHFSSIPISPSAPASEKKSIETTQSTLPPPLKRRKSVVKRPHSYSQQTEGASLADVLKKGAEDVPSVAIRERRTEETPSTDVPKERTEESSSAAEQSFVSNEPIEIETQMDRQLRREARLKKKQEAEKKRATQEKNQELPTRGAVSPLSIPMPTTEGENANTPLEESAERAQTEPDLTLEASSAIPEDPLSATLHSLLVSSPNSNKGDDSSTIIISSDTQHKFNECLKLYSNGLPSLAQNPEQFDRLYALLLDLSGQELALQQRISTLKKELAAAESTLARTSECRLLLQDQLKTKQDEWVKLQDKLIQLYKMNPLIKCRRKAAETAQANLIAEWNQLKDLLS
ncbi:uncharacterized protein LOC109710695 [Ananas comosus]|uniref:Uncharacterized protein LOC109710695 n=1 Tax=Ananas comosus TaxID=4615 RepID=A0A6P5F6Z2_ANACO|nr:uncharacterized protein LOC109710695 [Ananas comosus]